METMTTNDSLKARLIELIKQLSVKHGDFTLASGKKSSFYIDLRQSTLHHEASSLIGHVLLDLLEENGYLPEDIDAVGGLTMGADPVAFAIMHAAGSRGLDVDSFVVRKAAKDHGMKKQIEGPDLQGKKVVVVEDTSTTGGSPITAAQAVEAAGGEVLCVAVVVDRGDEAKQRIQQHGWKYYSALNLADLGLAG